MTRAVRTYYDEFVITASQLRQNIYRTLDEVAETGVPVEIMRKGVTLRIVVDAKPSKLARLKKRHDFIGDPTDALKSPWELGGKDEWLKEWTKRK